MVLGCRRVTLWRGGVTLGHLGVTLSRRRRRWCV